MALKEDIKKQFGDEVVLSGNSIVDKDQIIIPVSPALDLGLVVEFQKVVLLFLLDSLNVVKQHRH